MVFASWIFEGLRKVFMVFKAFVIFEVRRAVGALEVSEEKGVFGDFEAVVFKVFKNCRSTVACGALGWYGRVKLGWVRLVRLDYVGL